MSSGGDVYRLFGSENSPYSIKVRNYMRYKQIPHVWLIKNTAHDEEYQSVAKLPIVPAALCPDGTAMQDSTPMMEALEVAFPQHPAVQPMGDEALDEALRFIAVLLEEFGDEWANKWMFHYRWARPIDQQTVARRLVAEMLGPGDADAETLQQMGAMVQQRMSGRGFAVGSNETTAPLIEASFRAALALLEAHLSAGPGPGAGGGRPYLLGGRPSLADFSLAAQLYQALIDPTAGAIMRGGGEGKGGSGGGGGGEGKGGGGFPRVVRWCSGMNDPPPPPPPPAQERHERPAQGGGAAAAFEEWSALQPTLEPLLASEVRAFLVWSSANAEAIASKAESMSVDLGPSGGARWEQSVGGPQKYHAKSLKELRRKFAAASTNGALCDILSRCGCLEPLQSKPPQPKL
jgi:glutathione S-transferase